MDAFWSYIIVLTDHSLLSVSDACPFSWSSELVMALGPGPGQLVSELLSGAGPGD